MQQSQPARRGTLPTDRKSGAVSREHEGQTDTKAPGLFSSTESGEEVPVNAEPFQSLAVKDRSCRRVFGDGFERVLKTGVGKA